MISRFFLILIGMVGFTNISHSQNLNKWLINPKLNAPINNPALMGVFNATQISNTYTMGYQPTDFSVTQQHTNDYNIMKRITNSKTAVGGGFHYNQSYSNDFESSINALGLWMSIKNHWRFKNGSYLGLGLTIGHQSYDKKTFIAGLPGFPDTPNFFPIEENSDKNLISNLGLSYYGNNFFISLSNTGLTGLYEKGIGNKLILSVFGGLGRLNYYQTISYHGYGGVELATIKELKIGFSYGQNVTGNELNSLSAYTSYTYKKINLAYSASNNKVFYEQNGVYQNRGWVHSFTLSFIIPQ